MTTMVLQFMLEGLRMCTILCFNDLTTVEYLNKNVSIGQLLQHFSKFIVVCARSRPKMLTKTYNKEVCQTSKPMPSIMISVLAFRDFFSFLAKHLLSMGNVYILSTESYTFPQETVIPLIPHCRQFHGLSPSMSVVIFCR